MSRGPTTATTPVARTARTAARTSASPVHQRLPLVPRRRREQHRRLRPLVRGERAARAPPLPEASTAHPIRNAGTTTIATSST